jgi:GNAT superfamily N-acetyltransferase
MSAFLEDPVERWLYPEIENYQAYFPRFLAALGGAAFAHGTAWHLDGFSGVALWLPPGVEPDGDVIAALFRESVASEKLAAVFSVMDEMGAAHPRHPHWYLPWFGVDSAMQGKGLGGRLMAGCLQTIDNDHLPAYLETPNPRNISFYERHGFEIVGVTKPGACPPVTFMVRAAR